MRRPRSPASGGATIALAALAAAVTSGLWACGPPADAPPQVTLDLRGRQPYVPLEKVDFTLTDTEGRPYDFRDETDGELTLLFFGYTYCPDVCPIHMATLGAALQEMEPRERERVHTVMVSVDPRRDTPERLASWLAAFDSSFVGVTGTQEAVDSALAFYGYPATTFEDLEGGGYTVGHPSYIYAFTPDDWGRALYPAGTTRAAWIHDLRVLLEHDWGVGEEVGSGAADTASRGGAGGQPERPDRGPATGDAPARPAAVAGDLQIFDPYAPAPPEGDRTALYLRIFNGGSEPDTLVSLSTEVAGRSGLHDMTMTDGVMRMTPLEGGLPLPAGETVSLSPGHRHGMLEELTTELVPAGTLEVVLVFARAGRVVVPVRVVRYEEVGR